MRFCTFFALFFCSYYATAQSIDLNGVVESPSNEGLAYANVLVEQNQKFVKGTLTDEDGGFELQLTTGTYKLTVSYIGYADYIDTLTVNEDLNLGRITLSNDGVDLDEILVTDLKNELSAGIDKKVVYVTDALKSATTNLSEIMEMVPLVSMDMDGTPQIPGKQGVVVLVDGREPRIRANDLATVLRLIPSSQIVKIEIMTNPPAKYTKSNAAVINVVTDQSLQDGYLLNGWGKTDVLEAHGGGANLTVKRGKFSVSTWGGRWAYRSESEESSRQTNRLAVLNNQINQEVESDYKGDGFYGGIAPEYQFNDKNYLSMYVGMYNWNNDNFSTANLEIFNDEGQLVNDFGRNDQFFYGGQGIFSGIEYFRYFDEAEKEFSIDFGLDRSSNDERRQGTLRDTDPFYQLLSIESQNYSVDMSAEFFDPIDSTSSITYAFEIEKVLPYEESANFVSGVNPSEVQRNEDLSFLNTLEDMTQEFSLSYAKRIRSTNITLDVGQYFERINYFFDQEQRIERDFFFVIPKVSVTQKIGESNEIGLTYKFSADTPGRWSLNPNLRVSSDGLATSSGNPNLDPERSHEVEGNYGFYVGKFNIGATAFWRYSNNAIQGFTTVNDEGIRFNTFANTGEFIRSGMQLTLSGAIKKKMNVNLSGSLFDSRILRTDAATIQTVGFNLNGTVRYRLPKDFDVNLSGRYRGPEINIQGQQSAFYGIRASVRKGFLDDAVNLTLFFNDLFRSNVYTNESSDPSFINFNETVDRPAYFGARVNFKIGELKERPKSSKVGNSG